MSKYNEYKMKAELLDKLIEDLARGGLCNLTSFDVRKTDVIESVLAVDTEMGTARFSQYSLPNTARG
jgi:hypothetical protein